jgi:hypothetical protein
MSEEENQSVFNKIYDGATKNKGIFLSKDQTVVTSDIYSTISDFFNQSSYNSFYVSDIIDEEEKPILSKPKIEEEYFGFDDEMYCKFDYAENESIGETSKYILLQGYKKNNSDRLSKVTGTGTDFTQFLSVLNKISSTSVLRINLYGLLNASNDPSKMTALIDKISICKNLTHLNLGNNNIKIKNKSFTQKFSISNLFSNLKKIFKQKGPALLEDEANCKNYTNSNVMNLLQQKPTTKEKTTIEEEQVEQVTGISPLSSENVIFKLFKSFEFLEELNLSNNNISDIDTIYVLLNHKTLKSLNFAFNINGKDIFDVVEKNKNNTNTISQDNKIQYILYLQDLIENCILYNTKIESLNVSGNHLDTSRLIEVIKFKQPNLRSVVFDLSKLLLSKYLNNVSQTDLSFLTLKGVTMNSNIRIQATDDYMVNIDIQRYLENYLGKDPINLLNNPNLKNYIVALNDVNLGNENILIRKMTYEERKYKLIDIINYHQTMMGLSTNEKKFLCNEITAYNQSMITSSEGNEKQSSIGFGQSLSGVSFGYSMTNTKGVAETEVNTGKTPWTSYKIRQEEFSYPLKLLYSAISSNSDSNFNFFERNTELISDINFSMLSIRFTCDFLKTNKTITSLDLSKCAITDNLLFNIVNSLDNNNIISINLSDNILSNGSCTALSSLINVGNLENLNISGNSISDVGLTLLTKNLITNTTLKALVYSSANDTILTNFIKLKKLLCSSYDICVINRVTRKVLRDEKNKPNSPNTNTNQVKVENKGGRGTKKNIKRKTRKHRKYLKKIKKPTRRNRKSKKNRRRRNN